MTTVTQLTKVKLEKVKFWFFKHHVNQSILQLFAQDFQDENEIKRDTLLECSIQLVSESMEMVENMRESLLTFPDGHLQINFLVNIINQWFGQN